MIFKLYTFKLLTRWEFFQLLYHVLSFCDKYSEGMPQAFTDKVAELRIAFDVYDVELVQDRMPTPHELLQADEGRDYAIRKTYQLITYYSDHRFDPNKELAAKKLKRIFKSFGTGSKISRAEQDTKTAMISNLVQELSTESSLQHIATLNLTDEVAALNQHNRVFAKEQNNRYKLQANYVTGVVRDARMETQNKFMELVALINALSVVDGPEKYIELKQIFKTLVQESVTVARQRTKKKEVVSDK